MKSKVTCSVISDLIPLYVDNAASSDSCRLVEEHLEECKFCRAEYETMKKTVVIPADSDSVWLKNLSDKLGFRQLKWAALICSAAMILTAVGAALLYIHEENGGYGELIKMRQVMVISAAVMLEIGIAGAWALAYIRASTMRGPENSKAFRRRCAAALGGWAAACALCAAGFTALLYGVPASSEDVTVRTEFQRCEGAYLDREYVFHLTMEGKKGMNVLSVFSPDESTAVYYVRRVPIPLMIESKNFTGGYSCGGMIVESGDQADRETADESSRGRTVAAPPPDYCPIVKIVYADKTDIYDMREEGLFTK